MTLQTKLFIHRGHVFCSFPDFARNRALVGDSSRGCWGLMHFNKNISAVNPKWTTTNVRWISCRWIDIDRYGTSMDGYE